MLDSVAHAIFQVACPILITLYPTNIRWQMDSDTQICIVESLDNHRNSFELSRVPKLLYLFLSLHDDSLSTDKTCGVDVF